jgi:hypothetical protein
MPVKRKAALASCFALAMSIFVAVADAKPPKTAALRPIIAQIVADPQKYADRRIEIYGLVVGSDVTSRTFQLQDVSQHPLLIDGKRLPAVAVGDQVELAGILRVNGKDLLLAAKSLKRVQVVAGGGCC